MIQKLADLIHQGTGCDDVVAYQVAEQLVKEGFTLVDRDREQNNKEVRNERTQSCNNEQYR